jgi:hypothetical protein
MRVGLLHLGQSVLLEVSIIFLRSAVLAILAIVHVLLLSDAVVEFKAEKAENLRCRTAFLFYNSHFIHVLFPDFSHNAVGKTKPQRPPSHPELENQRLRLRSKKSAVDL